MQRSWAVSPQFIRCFREEDPFLVGIHMFRIEELDETPTIVEVEDENGSFSYEVSVSRVLKTTQHLTRLTVISARNLPNMDLLGKRWVWLP